VPTNGNSEAATAQATEHRVVDPAPCVGERPEDQRGPDHDEDEDQDVDGRVQRVVVDAEDGEVLHGRSKKVSRRGYRKSRPKA
jgi:hypothetical protein